MVSYRWSVRRLPGRLLSRLAALSGDRVAGVYRTNDDGDVVRVPARRGRSGSMRQFVLEQTDRQTDDVDHFISSRQTSRRCRHGAATYNAASLRRPVVKSIGSKKNTPVGGDTKAHAAIFR